MLRMRAGFGFLVVALSVVMLGRAGLGQEGAAAAVGGRESWPVAAASEEQVGGWEAAKAGALLALDRLRADIQVLGAVSVLQARLLEWNVELVASGAAPASLEASLCGAAEVRVWCELLPVTFGRSGGDADERG